MGAGGGVDQLGHDPELVAGPARAALDDVAGAELRADVADVGRRGP